MRGVGRLGAGRDGHRPWWPANQWHGNPNRSATIGNTKGVGGGDVDGPSTVWSASWVWRDKRGGRNRYAFIQSDYSSKYNLKYYELHHCVRGMNLAILLVHPCPQEPKQVVKKCGGLLEGRELWVLTVLESGVHVAHFPLLNITLYNYSCTVALYFLILILERSMDICICAVKYMKSRFMLCKHGANQENGPTRYYKIQKKWIYFCILAVFGTGIQWD